MSVPYWRNVRYTDDGCSIYECLNCYSQWEGRTGPGWFNLFEDVDTPTDDSTTVERNDGSVYHFRKREVPEYRPVWFFCPYCGITWKGPIRCDVDNERMLGPKRLKIEQMIRDRHRLEHWAHKSPRWWWCLEERTVWPDRDGEEPWTLYCKMNPEKVSAFRVYEILQYHRENQIKDSLFNTREEARVVRMFQSDFDNLPWFKMVHELS